MVRELLVLGVILGTNSAQGAILRQPVAKDSSVIEQSLCCANPSDTNFGTASTVDAGSYHNHARGLFGFDLQPGHNWLRAKFVIPASSVVGSSPADFSLSYTLSDWDESKVTWNNQPDEVWVEDFSLVSDAETVLDVTDIVNQAIEAGSNSITFAIDAKGQSNVFIPSKEAAGELGSASLQLQADTTIHPGDGDQEAQVQSSAIGN